MASRVLLFSLLFISQNTFAQIQITADDIIGLIGSTSTYDYDTSAQISVDVGLPGANQSYQFDQPYSAPPATYTRSIITPDMAPDGTDFPDANLATNVDFEDDSVSADFTNYTRVENSGWTQVGFVSRLMLEGFDTVLVRRGEELILPFPVTYGSTWNSARADTFEVVPGSSFISGSNTTHEVDGWGKITLPGGTYDCLRVRMDITSFSKAVFNGVPINNTSSTTISYQWISGAYGILAAVSSMTNETDPNFTMASSAERLRSATTNTFDHEAVQHLTIAPNPVINNRLEVSLQMDHPGKLLIRLLTSSGGLATTLWEGEATSGENRFDLSLDPGLSSGIYPVEILTENGKSVRQILVVR